MKSDDLVWHYFRFVLVGHSKTVIWWRVLFYYYHKYIWITIKKVKYWYHCDKFKKKYVHAYDTGEKDDTSI